jgi:hypothetical protein
MTQSTDVQKSMDCPSSYHRSGGACQAWQWQLLDVNLEVTGVITLTVSEQQGLHIAIMGTCTHVTTTMLTHMETQDASTKK